MDDNGKQIIVGTLIRDGQKIGVVFREIKSGTWTEQPLFNWKTNYEIFYDDGSVVIMGSDTIDRLIEKGTLEIIEEKKS